MTSSASAWLPRDILGSSYVVERLDRAVGQWSKAWFARGQVHVLASQIGDGLKSGADHCSVWRVWRACVAVSQPQQSEDRLIELTLDRRPDQAVVTDVDRKLVDGVHRRAVADLVERIERAFDIEGSLSAEPRAAVEPFDPAGVLEVVIGDDAGRRITSLALPLTAFVTGFKAALPAPRKPAGKLVSRSEALGPTPVSLDAILGSARLSMGDLRAIAPGDVLILDTPVHGPAKLRSGGRDTGLRGKPTEVDGCVALTLQA